jgi:hypothetical protein
VSYNNRCRIPEIKDFFFEKKKQKTFVHLGKSLTRTQSKTNKSFLVIFFQKRTYFCCFVSFILAQALSAWPTSTKPLFRAAAVVRINAWWSSEQRERTMGVLLSKAPHVVINQQAAVYFNFALFLPARAMATRS